MSAQIPRHFRCAALPVLAAVLLTQCSCIFSFKQDPAKTVTVEITGVNNASDRDEIGEALKGMTDGSSLMMTLSWSGDKMTVNLSPVRDVKAMSRKINFGEVTGVVGRTIKVEFVE